jgi:glycosyltransferase involved in cell wall biosynthesis
MLAYRVMNAMQSLSVVIPAYNSAESLPSLLERLSVVLRSLGCPSEIIVVNDGSRDATETVLADLSKRIPGLVPISLGRNYGQHNALLCGIRTARYDWIVTIDDDLQNPPEEIPKLLAKLNEGFDVVYGTPDHQHYGLMRGLTTRVTKWSFSIAMGLKIAEQISAFRAFRTQQRDAFAHFHGPYVSIDVLLSWGTVRFGAVPVRHDARPYQKSQYTLGKLISHTLNILAGFSTFPLRLATALGLVLSIFGILVLAYVVGRYFVHHGSVPGFPFLASIIAIFSGTQLFALGILGEYFARLYMKSMGRPSYVIKSSVLHPPL